MANLQRFLPPAYPKAKVWSRTSTYYECGICGAMHAVEWDGDCRQDGARLDIAEIEARHGDKWQEIEMAGLNGR